MSYSQLQKVLSRFWANNNNNIELLSDDLKHQLVCFVVLE